jgi:hypothetical protein
VRADDARESAAGANASPPVSAVAKRLAVSYETTTWTLDVVVRDGRLEASSGAMDPGVVTRLTPLPDGRCRIENGRFAGELLARADD